MIIESISIVVFRYYLNIYFRTYSLRNVKVLTQSIAFNVNSATESEGQLMECLNHCVQMIDRIGNVTRDVAILTPTPLQTQTLLAKVRDVADTYLQTVQAAGKAIGKDMNDPSMGVLMKKATSLASVLTTLMRSLRVFT